MKISTKERFENNTELDEETGCVFLKNRRRDRYSTFYVDGKQMYAHRYAYTIYRGEIPKGMHVLHSCDTPACVHPIDLYLGTHQDNMTDRNKKGRTAKGEKIASHKLTDKQVEWVKKLKGVYTGVELGEMFNVTRHHISAIHTFRYRK